MSGAILSALSEVPQTIDAIASRTGYTRREVEAILEGLRREGMAPICSGSRGVWLARSVDEYERNVEARRRRAVRQLVNVRGERRLLRRLQQPATLWDVA